jgi:ribonucleoside-diphosphate reductase alpha chain
MTTRRHLPNRRSAETFTFQVANLRYTCTVGRYPDGSVGEIFLSNHKADSTADVNARDGAIACSLALQHGADLQTLQHALCRDARGQASGPLGVALDIIAGSRT